MVSANYEKSLYPFFKHFSLGLCAVEFYFYDDTSEHPAVYAVFNLSSKLKYESINFVVRRLHLTGRECIL